MADFTQLEKLAGEIAAKKSAPPESSYTAQLISKGVEKCAKKFGEGRRTGDRITGHREN